MTITLHSGIDLHTSAFLLSSGLVILLAAYFIEDKNKFFAFANHLTMIGFIMGSIMTMLGIIFFFLCLVMKFFA